jgi:dihydroxyacetone kinase-like protein
VLNFDLAQAETEDEGVKITTVLINDEISAFPKEQIEERRGTTADSLVIHIAGAAAESGLDFDSLVTLLKKAVYNSRSLGVSTAPCTLPQTGLATFELPAGRMEFGMGLHGEAGVKQVDLLSADETAAALLDEILEDLPFESGDEVIALINGYGSTTRMEMFIVMRRVHSYLQEKGISVYGTELGEFCTAQEMGGISLTLMKLDHELKKYYDMPADSPGYVKH